MIGFAPNLTQEAFAADIGISTAVANDPDDVDTVYSVGDTVVITFADVTNATGGGTMTNAEIIANFTWTTADVDSDTLSGTWDGTSTILTILVNAIGGVDPPIPNTDTINYDAAGTGKLGYLNDTEIVGNAVTLTGDFGLFVAVTSSNGSGCEGDCQAPTLGLDKISRRVVDNGFSYNGKSVDVEYYFTPYPLVTVQVGKQNVAEFKIYENMGPDKISHFELAFGLANGESIGMSKAVINWDKTFDGVETVTLDDPENVLDSIKVTTTEGSCSDELQQKCLIVKVVHTFRAPLDFNILATNVWDFKRNAWQNYYNHGIEVVGESLNPPKEYDGINKGQIYHLTETSKTSAVDEFGNLWSLKYGVWAMDYIPNEKIIDGITKHGIDRNNAWFNFYKQGQELVAKEVLEQSCPFCSDEEFAEINDIFSYEFPKQTDKLLDLEIKNKMLQESKIAGDTLQQILDSLYRNYHY